MVQVRNRRNLIPLGLYFALSSQIQAEDNLSLTKTKAVSLEQLFDSKSSLPTTSTLEERLGKYLLSIGKAIGSNPHLRDLAASQTVSRDSILVAKYDYMLDIPRPRLESSLVSQQFQNGAFDHLKNNYLESSPLIQMIKQGAKFNFSWDSLFKKDLSKEVQNPSQENQKIVYRLKVRDIAVNLNKNKSQAAIGPSSRNAFLNADKASLAWDIIPENREKSESMQSSDLEVKNEVVASSALTSSSKSDGRQDVFHKPELKFNGSLNPKNFSLANLGQLSLPAMNLSFSQAQGYYAMDMGTSPRTLKKETLSHRIGLPLGSKMRWTRVYDEKLQPQQIQISNLLYFDRAPSLNLIYFEVAKQAVATLDFAGTDGSKWALAYVGKPSARSAAEYSAEKLTVSLSRSF